MTIGPVGTVKGNASSAAGGTFIASASFTVTSGDFLEVCVTNDYGGSDSVSSITDTMGGITWNRRKQSTDTGFGQNLEVWYSTAMPSSGSITVTANFTGTVSYRGIGAGEISGSSGPDSGVLNGNVQTSPGTSTDAVTSTAMPAFSAAPAMVSGWSMCTGSNAAPNFGTGFADGSTCIDFGGGTNLVRWETKRVTATTAIAATFTALGDDHYITIAGGWLESGGGGGGVFNPYFYNMISGSGNV